MTFKTLTKITLGALLLTAHASYAKSADVFTESQQTQIQDIVKNYLIQNPEVIEQALQAAILHKEQQHLKKISGIINDNKKEIFQNSGDPIIGPKDAAIEIVVFMDPYCGYCRKFEKVLSDVRKKRDDFKTIYKILPILGDESMKAGREMLAANSQNKFTDYHDALTESAARTRQARLDLAQASGLNLDLLKKDLKKRNIKKQLEGNINLARKLEIQGTPAMVIGETFISGYVDENGLNELLDKQKSGEGKKPLSASAHESQKTS